MHLLGSYPTGQLLKTINPVFCPVFYSYKMYLYNLVNHVIKTQPNIFNSDVTHLRLSVTLFSGAFQWWRSASSNLPYL